MRQKEYFSSSSVHDSKVSSSKKLWVFIRKIHLDTSKIALLWYQMIRCKILHLVNHEPTKFDDSSNRSLYAPSFPTNYRERITPCRKFNVQAWKERVDNWWNRPPQEIWFLVCKTVTQSVGKRSIVELARLYLSALYSDCWNTQWLSYVYHAPPLMIISSFWHWIWQPIRLVFIWFNRAFEGLQNGIKTSRKILIDITSYSSCCSYICLLPVLLTEYMSLLGQLMWSPARLVLIWFNRDFLALRNDIKLSKKKQWQLKKFWWIRFPIRDFECFPLVFDWFWSKQVMFG